MSEDFGDISDKVRLIEQFLTRKGNRRLTDAEHRYWGKIQRDGLAMMRLAQMHTLGFSDEAQYKEYLKTVIGKRARVDGLPMQDVNQVWAAQEASARAWWEYIWNGDYVRQLRDVPAVEYPNIIRNFKMFLIKDVFHLSDQNDWSTTNQFLRYSPRAYAFKQRERDTLNPFPPLSQKVVSDLWELYVKGHHWIKRKHMADSEAPNERARIPRARAAELQQLRKEMSEVLHLDGAKFASSTEMLFRLLEQNELGALYGILNGIDKNRDRTLETIAEWKWITVKANPSEEEKRDSDVYSEKDLLKAMDNNPQAGDWCIGNRGTMRSFLQNKKGQKHEPYFRVYAGMSAPGEDGRRRIVQPEIAIHIADGKITQLRGNELKQELDVAHADAASRELQRLEEEEDVDVGDWGEKVKGATTYENLKRELNRIAASEKDGVREPMAKKYVEMLYRTRYSGVGYSSEQEDKIKDLQEQVRSGRPEEAKRDYALSFGYKPEEIALTERELLQGGKKVFLGDLKIMGDDPRGSGIWEKFELEVVEGLLTLERVENRTLDLKRVSGAFYVFGSNNLFLKNHVETSYFDAANSGGIIIEFAGPLEILYGIPFFTDCTFCKAVFNESQPEFGTELPVVTSSYFLDLSRRGFKTGTDSRIGWVNGRGTQLQNGNISGQNAPYEMDEKEVAEAISCVLELSSAVRQGTELMQKDTPGPAGAGRVRALEKAEWTSVFDFLTRQRQVLKDLQEMLVEPQWQLPDTTWPKIKDFFAERMDSMRKEAKEFGIDVRDWEKIDA